MKKSGKIKHCLLASVLFVLSLTACAANPNKRIVTGKSDGVFEANMTVPATAPLDAQIRHSETFTSTDGTAEYVMDLDQKITSQPLPIVEVVPHFFTGEEVKQICDILLGSTEFREQVHEKDPRYSKSELQKKLSWMSEIANSDAMGKLISKEDDSGYDYAEEMDILKRHMQYFTVMLESAPEGNPREVCDWTYKDAGLYVSPSYGDQFIQATTVLGDTEYCVSSVKRDKQDYKNSRLYVELGNSRDYLYKQYLRSKLLRTDKPTREQIDALAQKAQSLLDQMDVGQWQVADVRLEEDAFRDSTEYTVTITALPVLNGISALFDQPIEDLLSKDTNASNYLRTVTTISFSANGDLIYFDMCAPVDVTTVVNEGAATLPMEELLDKAKDHLSLSGVAETSAYYILSLYYDNPVSCKVTLDKVDYGLLRVRKANQDYTYYYIPALAVYGKTGYYDQGTDKEVDPIYIHRDPDKSYCLFWINAVDGSIVR